MSARGPSGRWAARPPDRPQWLERIASAALGAQPLDLSPFTPPSDGSARESAVLMLFGEADGHPDVLLTERAHSLRSHAGQVAFPGGALDEGESSVDAALREAAEETGLDPHGVDVVGTVAPQWIPISNFTVTPVLAWWQTPSPVHVVDPAEVASVQRIDLETLLDPANRCQVRLSNGYLGPGFEVGGLLVWGFTAGLLSRIFALAGLERPWNRANVRPLPVERVEQR